MRLVDTTRRVLGLSYLILGGLSAALAQNNEELIVQAEFTVYSMHRLTDLNFVHGDRNGSTPLTFFSSARSTSYEYEGPNPLVFFRQETGTTIGDSSPATRTKVGEVNLPTGSGKYLLIFFPDKNSDADGYLIYPMDDSTSALPYGSIKLFNATPYTLEGVIGRERVRLAPGPSESFRLNSNSISVGLGFSHEGKFHKSFNSPVRLNKESRGLMMIFPPFVKGSAIVQTRLLQEARKEEEREELPVNNPVTATTGL